MRTPEERANRKKQLGTIKDADLTVKLIVEEQFPPRGGGKVLLKHHEWAKVTLHPEGIRARSHWGVVNMKWDTIRFTACEPKFLQIVNGAGQVLWFIPNGGTIDKRDQIEAIIKQYAPESWRNEEARHQVQDDLIQRHDALQANLELKQRQIADSIRSQSGIATPRVDADLARMNADKALLINKEIAFGGQLLLKQRVFIKQGRIHYGNDSVALIGAEVSVEDASKRRVTATRLVTGGALLGASALKTSGNAYVIIDGTDGQLRIAVKLKGKRDFEMYVSPKIAELTTIIRQATSAQASLAASHSDQTSKAADSEPVSDPLEQIQKLGELHDAGVLTDEEFTAKKEELLKRV